MKHALTQLDRLLLAGGLIDADGELVALNDPCRRLLGWTDTACAAALGQPFATLFESMSSPLASQLLQVARAEGHWHGDLFFRDGHDAPLPVYLVVSAMDSANASAPPASASSPPTQFMFFALDYAEQHFALSDQLRRQALLQRMWRDFPIGVIALDGEGRVLQINGAAQTLWDSIGATLTEADALPDVFAPLDQPMRDAYDEALSTRQSRKLLDVPLAGPDGPVVHFEVNPQPRKGPLQFVLLFIEDRTEAIRTEAHRRETERFASLGFMAASIAHEINNPLQSLQGALELLRSRCARLEIPSDEQTQLDKATSLCLSDVTRIAEIISPILNLARTRLPQPVEQPLPELLERIIESFQTHPRLAGIALTAETIGVDEISTDPGLLQQILTNLVINAAQAMEGSGEVRLRATCDTTNPDLIRLQIRDTGPGIAPKVAKHLFTPFYTTKQPGEGTGLGLYASRAIAIQLGGWLEFLPSEGLGACFELTLPRRYVATETPDDRAWIPHLRLDK